MLEDTRRITIYLYKLDSSLPLNLTTADKSRLSSIKSDKARVEYACSHTLLNNILQDRLDLGLEDLTFSYNSCNKPYLSPALFNSSSLYFSLSHSNNAVAIAISEGIEIGIDLEDNTRRHPDSCTKLAKRYFSKSEQKYISDHTSTHLTLAEKFFQIWTLKEAYLKATGSGINMTLSSIDFQVRENHIILTDKNRESTPEYTFYTTYFQNYSLALAANTSLKLEICACNHL